MAVIQERLEMVDAFSASFNSYIRLGEQASGASERAARASQSYQSVLAQLDRQLVSNKGQLSALVQEQEAMKAAGKESSDAYRELEQRIEKLNSTIRVLNNQYQKTERQADAAATAAKQFSEAEEAAAQSSDRSARSADKLSGSIRSLVGAYVSLRGLSSLMDLSDEMSATTARLDQMNDGLQSTAELQNRIMASAQRTRGSYQDTADMVAKLGTLAGGAFNSSQEIIAFAEQINKQMVLAGTSTTGSQAAMLQLTQAMSSGVLRGEELNSILEQAPTIAQSIASYMGVTIGEMRELASEGKVTAEVVKNAMFDAAEKTNEKFSQMPVTWGQVWSQAQNVLIQAFQPVLDVVGKLAGWIGQNMDTAIAAFYGLAAAVAVYTAAQWVATGAAQAFFASLMSNPILLAVAVAIGVVVALVYKFIKASGGLSIAWLRACDYVLTAWDALKIGVMTGVYAVLNFLDQLQLGWSIVGTAVANFAGDMKVSVLTLLQSMINGAIDLLNDFIEFVNQIPGVAITPIEHVTFAADAALENEAAKASRNQRLDSLRQEVAQDAADRAQALEDMWAERENSHAARQAEIAARQAQTSELDEGNTLPDYTPYEGVPQDVKDIKSGVGGIQKTLNATAEDIKSLVDIAERRYINNINLNAPAPIITIQGANTGNTEADRRNMADAIRDILLEQTAAGAVRSTAQVF